MAQTVDDRERRFVAACAFASALLILSAHIGAKATRDALFLSHFPATALPRAMMAAAVVSLIFSLALARLLSRSSPVRVTPAVFASSGALFVGEWLLLPTAPRLVAVMVYLHLAGFGAVLISAFWSLVNERFDPHTGKAVIARVSGFAALGGVVGGLVASRISAWLGIETMLLVLGGTHLVCGVVVLGVGGAATADAGRVRQRSAFEVVRRMPLLQQMAGLVALVAVIEALLDYALKAEAASRLATAEELIQFFAVFYTTVGLLAFALQTTLGSRVLHRLGLGGSIALLPASVLLTGTLAGVLPRFWTLVTARGVSSALTNSFFRAGFELLYAPLSPAQKRPTKTFIDVGAQRLGDLLGGGAVLGLLFLLPDARNAAFALAAGLVGALGLLLVARLNRTYVRQLAHNLRRGAGTARRRPAQEGPTQAVVVPVSDTHVGIDRAELLARIRYEEKGHDAEAAAAEDIESFLELVKAVSARDPDVARRALAGAAHEPRLVPHVLPLLERIDSVFASAVAFLRGVAPRATGQLVDALLDPKHGTLVRRRLPRVLGDGEPDRALEGLRRALTDDDFEIRFACARAAARLVAASPQRCLEREAVHALVGRELAVNQMLWEQQERRSEDRGGVLDSVIDAPPEAGRSVEHAFTMLGLAHGPELMGSILRALYGTDLALHGTALEYLETTLPQDLRAALWPRIPIPTRGARRPRRQTGEIAEELLRAAPPSPTVRVRSSD
jgi:hypothetical protein